MVLPTTPILATDAANAPKRLLLYGNPKIGKTEAITQLPGCLLIDLEDNSDHLTGLKVKVKNLVELGQVLAAIAAKPSNYTAVALDSVTILEDWCNTYATAKYKNSVIGKNFKGESVIELPSGSGYHHLREALKEQLVNFFNCHPRTIIIGQTKDRFVNGEVDKEGKELALTGKCQGIVRFLTSANGFLYRKKNAQKISELRVNFESDNENGSHVKRLAGKDFVFDWKEIYPN